MAESIKHHLTVGWYEDQRLQDGGCWALFKPNGKPWLLAAKAGRRSCTARKMQAVAETWNLWAVVHVPELNKEKEKVTA